MPESAAGAMDVIYRHQRFIYDLRRRHYLLGREQMIADPWILIPRLFDPAYVAGWSAAEHWELTEQIFRSVCVVTGRTVWRGGTKVQVSDPHRTIIDMLDEPSTGGGIRHVDDCLGVYLERPDADLGEVIAYAG